MQRKKIEAKLSCIEHHFFNRILSYLMNLTRRTFEVFTWILSYLIVKNLQF